jgi:transposase-like protein
LPPTTAGKRTYSSDFKLDAVARARRGSAPIAEIASDLGIAPSTLRTWVRHASAGDVVSADPPAADAAPVAVTPAADVEAPPTVQRVLFWAVGWRVGPEYHAWARQRIESPDFRRFALARLAAYFCVGLAARVVAGELVLIRPSYSLQSFVLPFALLAGVAASYFAPSRMARRRHLALVGQGLETDTRRVRVSTLAARSSNGVRLLLPVVLVAGIFAIGLSAAKTSHAAVCPPGATNVVAPPADIVGSFVAPAGFAQRPDTSAGHGVLNVAAISANARHPADAAKLLTCNGFVDGYARGWTATAGTPRGILTKVYAFATATGARNYARLDVAASLKTSGTSTLALPSVTDTTLITSSKGDSANFNFAVAIGASGRFVFVVREFSSGEVVLAEIEALVRAQAPALQGR